MVLRSDDYRMVRDPAETGLRIAKRRHQLNRSGFARKPGEPVMRQADLARLLGVAPSTVANWERGKSYPERYLGAVEAALGINLTDGPGPDPTEEALLALDHLDPAERDKLIAAWRGIRDGDTGHRQRAG